MASLEASQDRNPSNLSDDELYSELEKYGEHASPLTKSTRSIFEKRLFNLWKFSPDGDKSNTDNNTASDTNCNDVTATSHKIKDHASEKSNGKASISELNTLQSDHASSSQIFFGVSLLSGSSCSEEDEPPLVFTDKKEALRAAKKYKGARFKAFSSREEAVLFASQSPESVCSSPIPKSPGISLPLNVPESDGNSGIVGEKPSLFKAPKSQEMVKLRKAIECGDAEYFKETVWSNPRYLISSGDTPAVLQEGFRYNGLHVASKSKQPSMCRLIMDTIEDPKFMQLLYTDDTEEIRHQRITFITDLYLNMPDKGLCETPLHFASKFGCSKSVEILASHPACVTDRANKYGQKPREIICDRCPGATTELKKQIEAVFEDRYFVPVLRSENNSSQPLVGEPWSPTKDPTKNPVTDSPSTPVSPKEPSLTVQAVAGPMAAKQAELFYKHWKTPSRSLLHEAEARIIRLSDPEKGLERIGRELAQNFKVPWKEYWPFLDSWYDLSSPEGLLKLDDHLKKIYTKLISEVAYEEIEEKVQALAQTTIVESPIVKNSSTEQSLSENANFTGLSEESLSPISDICQRLANFHANSSSSSSSSPASPMTQNCSSLNCQSKDNLDDIAKTLKFELSPLKNTLEKNDCINEKFIKGKISEFQDEKKCKELNDDINKENNDIESKQEISNLNFLCSTVVRSLSTILSDMVISFPNFIPHEVMTHKYLKDNVLSCVAFLQVAVTEYAIGNNYFIRTIHDNIAKQVLTSFNDILTSHEMKLVHRCLSSYLNIYYDMPSSEDEEEGYTRQYQTPVIHHGVTASKWHHLKCIVRCLCDRLENKELQQKSEDRACSCLWPFQHSNTTSPSPSSSRNASHRYCQKDSCNNDLHSNLKRNELECNANVSEIKDSRFSEKNVLHSNNQNLIRDNKVYISDSEEDLSLSLPDRDSDEDDVFYTPPSSVCSFSSNLEATTPDEGLEVFIQGKEPSKLDLDVFRALKNAHIDESLYPHISRWKHLISSFPKEVTESWQTPHRQKSSRKPVSSSLLSTPPHIPQSTSTPQDVQITEKKHHTAIINPKNLYESFLGWEESGGD